jgi:hypothetical protein
MSVPPTTMIEAMSQKLLAVDIPGNARPVAASIPAVGGVVPEFPPNARYDM